MSRIPVSFYKISLDRNPNITEHSETSDVVAAGFGFRVYEEEDFDFSTNVVIFSDGSVFITSNLFSMLGGDAKVTRHQMEMGGTKLYDVANALVFDSITDAIYFPRYNSAQHKVARRNEETFEWITSL